MKYTSSLKISNLSYSFKNRELWSNLNFSLEPGSSIFITGESGSGKTTLLQCLGSIEKPTSGSISFDRIYIEKIKGRERRDFLRNSVSFVFQNSGLVPSWSLRKNLELGGFRTHKNKDVTEKVLMNFSLSPHLLDQPSYSLSGGEQQRTALARAALRQTPLIILDEPTAALDDSNTTLVSNFIANHNAQGGIAVIATHDSRLLSKDSKILHLPNPTRNTFS